MHLETKYSQLACPCCKGTSGTPAASNRCSNCIHAIGFHTCTATCGGGRTFWRQGTLIDTKLDVQEALKRASSQNKSLDDIRAKAIEYVEAKALTHNEMVAGRILK